MIDEQRRILIQTILDDPDNDEARLIYADYLQTLGDPRGELITMQTNNARKTGQLDEIEASERKLLDDHEAKWLGPWHGKINQWRFRRGFLEELEVTLDTFVEIASQQDPLSDHFAHLRRLHLDPHRGYLDANHYMHRVVDIARPLRLHTLELDIPLRADAMLTLARGTFLEHVTTLQIRPDRGNIDMAFGMLWRSPHLRRVKHLDFREATDVGERALLDLANTSRWKQIERFTHVVKYSQLQPAGVIALVEGNRRLVHLELAGHYGLDNTVLAAIAETQTRLEELSLAYARITNDAAGNFARLDALRSLDLRHTQVGDDGLSPILALPSLESLNIAHTRMTAVAARRLVREAPPSLRTLTITIPNLDGALVGELRKRFQLHRWR